ncbi:hypothetical protein HT031_005528 [Scenedesmus sp. PABB004]|nr:hypothetical protein HT031_005528 [Scenedesmus sp. PABB004]
MQLARGARQCAPGAPRRPRGRAPVPPVRAAPVFRYSEVELDTQPGIAVLDVTPAIRDAVAAAGVVEGCVHVLSRHTTTAVAINECEARLLDDIRQFLRRLAPPGDPYLHNDLHLREAPPGWPGGWAAWCAARRGPPPPRGAPQRRRRSDDGGRPPPPPPRRRAAQEPENAHSHLLSMVLGNSETIPVTEGRLALGQWQSVMLVELDGPRKRSVGIQVVGVTQQQ